MPATQQHGDGTRRRTKVLPEYARTHNRALVLQTLFHDGEMSRADLARRTGLTRVSISDLATDLIDDGIIVEKGQRPASGPGKPATIVDIDRTGHQVIALDLSAATVYRGAVMNLAGEVVERLDVPRPPDGDGDDAIAVVIALGSELIQAATRPVLGVGIGAPGIVSTDGVVLTAPNIGWQDVPLRQLVTDALERPVIVANDANAAALAEYTFAKGSRDLLLVKMGRGFGAGLLSGGVPVLGSRFAAGEIGHVTVGTDSEPACSCGKRGCLEAWVSATQLSERISAGGDREAVLRDAGERLGIALAPVVGMLDLSEIVLSGPGELFDETILDATIDTIRARTLARFHDGVHIRLSEHGDDIVLHGAVVTVMSGLLGVT